MGHQAMKRHGIKEGILNVTYYMIPTIYMTFGKGQSYGDSKKSNICQEWRRRDEEAVMKNS